MDIEKTINNETNDQDKCLGLPVTSYEPASLIGFRKLILITLMTATTGEAHPQSCFAGVDRQSLEHDNLIQTSVKVIEFQGNADNALLQ